jgi:hypothetical protein
MVVGACGHTYGNHNIWQMWQPGRQPVSIACTPWYESIDYPGAYQAGYMQAFFESIPWQKLRPISEIIKSGPNTDGKEVLVAAIQDGAFVVVYSPYGINFSLDLSNMKTETLRARWFNPRNNSFSN